MPGDAVAEIAEALTRYVGVGRIYPVPYDRSGLDAALANGRSLTETSSGSPARKAIAALAADLAGAGCSAAAAVMDGGVAPYGDTLVGFIRPLTGNVSPVADIDVPVILLSHRAPVTFGRDGGERTASRGAGGLVSALMGLASGLDGSVWVCAATTDEDRAVVEEYGQKGSAGVEVSLFPNAGIATEVGDSQASTTLRMLAIDPVQHEQFYGQIANPLLWFVQHGLVRAGRPSPTSASREHDAFTHGYVAVNEAFADAVAGEVESRGGRALVMLHDYHFYLVAARVRERCPDVTMSHFVHIPWPGPNEWTDPAA